MPNMQFSVMLLQGDLDNCQPFFYFDHRHNPVVALIPDAQWVWVEKSGH